MSAALLRRMATTKTTTTITAARYCCSCFLNANTHRGNNSKRSKRGRRTLTSSMSSDTTTTTTTTTITTKPLRILSWNVNGLRGTMKKHPHFVKDLYEKTRFDILCVQETKMQEGNVGEMLAVIEDDEDENDENGGPGGLHNQNDQLAAYFSCSTARKGYSGVAMITRPDVKFTSKPREGFHQRALDEADFEKTEENLEAFHLFNREGRVMTCELEKAVIINTYVPNSGEGLKRLRERIEVWEPAMKAHVSCLREDMMKEEEEEKAIVWVGDFNVAHEKRDLWGNWTQNETSAGFTPEERLAFSNQLKDLRLTDSFRYLHPTADDKFTYWSYRAKSREKNRGWRIDYALVSDTMKENIKDAFIVSDFLGSDHCPLGVELRV